MIHFDVIHKEQELHSLEKQTMNNEFWNDAENSSKILKQINILKNKVEVYKKLQSELNNIIEMDELIRLEPDEELSREVIKSTLKIEKEIDRLEITTLLSGKYDNNNAILTIHPGAGGTEAQDWAEMLYRMYARWANAHGYELKELDN